MNILFFCDWDLTLLYHKVAIQLKKKNINPYALVIGKNFKEYLDKNNENIFIDYEVFQDKIKNFYVSNLNELDLGLSQIQKKYPEKNLWLYAWGDRRYINSSHLLVKKQLLATFNYCENILKKHSIDAVLINANGSMLHLILWDVAKKNNIKIFNPLDIRIDHRYILCGESL